MERKIFDFEAGEVLLVHKPIRWTSFDIVGKIRTSIGGKKIKVGHAGTLDPLAEGLLIVCTGKKTKLIDTFQALTKEYTGELRFGATRPSYDLETEIDQWYPTEHIDLDLLKEKVGTFLGTQFQISPNYSARRINGVRAYEKARLGEEIDIKPREIRIDEFEIHHFNNPDLSFRVRCSKGTYIRSLVRDLGLAVGSGAYLSQLTRTAIGEYLLKDAWQLAELCEEIKNQKSPDTLNSSRETSSLQENRNIRMHKHDPQ